MKRRAFVLGCGGLALRRAALAQAGAPKVGFVSWFPPEMAVHAVHFRKGLRDLGRVEGRDVTVHVHFTSGDREGTRAVVRRLLAEGAAVLAVEATPAVAVAKAEAGSVPIVMAGVSDPIAAGFAESLSRPGGTITGRTMLGPDLAGKRIDIIRELKPGLRTVAFLGSSADVNAPLFVAGTKAETDRVGLDLRVHLVDGPGKIDASLFGAIRQGGAEVVIVQPIFTGQHRAIVAIASAAGLPVVSDYAMFAEAGGVLALGVDSYSNMRRAAYFVDRILNGANPADLPIENPTEIRLTLNLPALRRFGWTANAAILAQADEVIE